MQAIREIATIQGNSVTVYLPDDFPSGSVEIIVLPYTGESALVGNNDLEWKTDFLSISQWESEAGSEEVGSWKIHVSELERTARQE